LKSQAPILLLPTAYLPPIEYMAWLAVAESAEIELHETYPKQTWRNRCSILTANGPLALSIPVEKPLGNHSPTGMVRISKHLPWQKQHWRSIESAYSKSAFFLYYKEVLEPLFQKEPPEKLTEWNQLILDQLLEALGLSLPIRYTRNFERESSGKTDLRFLLSPKAKNRDVKTHEAFKEYFQPFLDRHGFFGNQSIIDLLFNLGPDTPAYLQQCGEELIAQFREG